MSIKMHAYNNGSASAKALRDALGIKMLLPNGKGKWKGKAGDVLINWGNSTPHPNKGGAKYTNEPNAVGVAANKLKAHRAFDNDRGAKEYNLPFTTDRKIAEGWAADGDTVVCRQKLTGHSGEGIVLAEKAEDIVNAPLYTKYMKKKDEYRIHVFDGEIIDVQRKARKLEVEDDKVNWKVRNLDGGFIFARDNVVAPVAVRDAALFAIRSLGLLHGAVDIGHGKGGTYLYEVNTACGLAGSTLITYKLAFEKYLKLPQQDVPDDYIEMDEQNKRTLEQAVERFNNIHNNGEPEQPNLAPEPVMEEDVVVVNEPVVDEPEKVMVYIRRRNNNRFNLVQAIKEVRVLTRMGLKDAKTIVDFTRNLEVGLQNYKLVYLGTYTRENYDVFQRGLINTGFQAEFNHTVGDVPINLAHNRRAGYRIAADIVGAAPVAINIEEEKAVEPKPVINNEAINLDDADALEFKFGNQMKKIDQKDFIKLWQEVQAI